MKRPVIWVTVLASAAIALSVNAAEMKIKPGKWEFRAVSSLPTPGGPKEHVNYECITDSTISPQDLMKDMQQDCQLSDSSSSGSSMSWKVTCKNPGGEMTGAGNVKSAGDTLTGDMSMTMSFQGQQMKMNMHWDGKHIGSCD